MTRTKTVRNRSGNLVPIMPIPEPLVPGARLLPFPQQEALTEYDLSSSEKDGPQSVRVVLELLVGGNGDRTVSGEVCVAVQPDDDGPLFVLKGEAASLVMLIDLAVEPELRKFESSLEAFGWTGTRQQPIAERGIEITRRAEQTHHLQQQSTRECPKRPREALRVTNSGKPRDFVV